MATRIALFLSLLLALPLAAATADLGVFSSSFVPAIVLDPGEQVRFSVTVFSKGPDAADHAKLTVTLPPGATLISVQTGFGPCQQQGSDVVCESPTPFGLFQAPATFTIKAPGNVAGGAQPLTARVSSDTPDPDSSNNVLSATITTRHLFVVDTEHDTGATSLRGQIDAMNATCNGTLPCKIVFSLRLLIEPLSPLPQITVCNSGIDGGGAANDPIRVTLQGALLKQGSGLEIHTTCHSDNAPLAGVTVQRLAITGFPENGVGVITGERRGQQLGVQHVIQNCLIQSNGYRGIATNAPDAGVSIFANAIANNVASGIALYSVGFANVFRNQIRANGASGLFAANGDVNAGENEIFANGQFGISTLRNASVLNAGNVIHDNGRQPIDLLMDGPSRAGSLRPPVLTDAFYDPVSNRTIIRGHLIGNNDASPDGGTFDVFFAAADRPNPAGFVDAQRSLFTSARIVPRRGGDFDQAFEASANGDLRGQWIIGYTSYALFPDLLSTTSSEFSDAVVVH